MVLLELKVCSGATSFIDVPLIAVQGLPRRLGFLLRVRIMGLQQFLLGLGWGNAQQLRTNLTCDKCCIFTSDSYVLGKSSLLFENRKTLFLRSVQDFMGPVRSHSLAILRYYFFYEWFEVITFRSSRSSYVSHQKATNGEYVLWINKIYYGCHSLFLGMVTFCFCLALCTQFKGENNIF